jgi:antitoxin ParD1/3/4
MRKGRERTSLSRRPPRAPLAGRFVYSLGILSEQALAALTRIAIMAIWRMEDDMATMNISLPDAMKEWVEAQTETGMYGNSSDVVRDLIRKAQIREEKIANMQRLVDEARASGISERSVEEIWESAIAKHEAGKRARP